MCVLVLCGKVLSYLLVLMWSFFFFAKIEFCTVKSMWRTYFSKDFHFVNSDFLKKKGCLKDVRRSGIKFATNIAPRKKQTHFSHLNKIISNNIQNHCQFCLFIGVHIIRTLNTTHLFIADIFYGAINGQEKFLCSWYKRAIIDIWW